LKIKMAGIDYNKAKLSQREIFAFSKTEAHNAMQSVKEAYILKGCVLVSTCNRTEIWICEDDDQQTDLPKVLCSLKGVNLEEYRHLLTVREGIEAVRHLFETTCGLKSQIWGEDQILAQIKLSIESARNAETTNEVMEKLFQTAITSAKKIKSTIRLTAYDESTATKTLEVIKSHFPVLPGLKCLVLGNGEMGRMVSSMLTEYDAHVTVTIREYKHKTSIVPKGCMAINYENRIAEIKHADLIISATSSPHYTIKPEDVSNILVDNKHRVFIDLAVPRDIHPEIAEYDNVLLLDIESLGGVTQNKASNRSLLMAKQIIDKYMVEFLKWSIIREVVPLINSTVNASESVNNKLQQEIKQLGLDSQKGNVFDKKVISATTTTIRQILSKRDNTDNEYLFKSPQALGLY